MLGKNIKALRKSKGLSQEELAVKLNVVRQTISKWEQGLSVPDADMLISISEEFETPVNTLLGETIIESKVDDLKLISEKLDVFCKTFLHNIAKKKYTPLRLKFFSDYFGLDRAFLSRKLSPVKLKMCA